MGGFEPGSVFLETASGQEFIYTKFTAPFPQYGYVEWNFDNTARVLPRPGWPGRRFGFVQVPIMATADEPIFAFVQVYGNAKARFLYERQDSISGHTNVHIRVFSPVTLYTHMENEVISPGYFRNYLGVELMDVYGWTHFPPRLPGQQYDVHDPDFVQVLDVCLNRPAQAPHF